MTPVRYRCPVCGQAVVVLMPHARPETCSHRGTVRESMRPSPMFRVIEEDECS